MVKLNRIYTRTGDDGTTGLVDGSRVAKHEVRMHCIGEVDEANSFIGLARLQAEPELEAALERIQNDLFDLGADIATPLPDAPGIAALRVSAAQVERLEREIDTLNERLAPLTSFVLPGGSAASAYLHLARAVTRRAERSVSALAAAGQVNPFALQYLNRLSDLLFVMSRVENDNGSTDVLWVPGNNR